jgi:uncharacterized SAM-binding protein YcdF (DUF218 family)
VIWGLLARKERLGLSGRGWLAVFFVLVSTAGFVLVNIYPFLAVTKRVNADVLVVEGWIHEYAVGAAAEEFRDGSCRRIFTTGGPVSGNGGYVNDFQTSASVGRELLKKNGVPREAIQMVPSRVIGRDRTFSAAVALRDWLSSHKVQVHAANVLTEDLHARRTRLLFQKAFGDGVKVGIISIANPDYDAKHWWRYSEGFKDVISEAAAYVYARFLFFPPASSLDAKTVVNGRAQFQAMKISPQYGAKQDTSQNKE